MPENVERSGFDGRRQDGILAREVGDLTRELIEDALAWARGNQTEACQFLGCNKVFLWKALKRFGIDRKEVARAAEEGQWVYRTSPAGAPWSEVSESAPAPQPPQPDLDW